MYMYETIISCSLTLAMKGVRIFISCSRLCMGDEAPVAAKSIDSMFYATGAFM